jgi:hypothetical protein
MAPYTTPSYQSTGDIYENSKYLNPEIRNCDLRYIQGDSKRWIQFRVYILITAFIEVFALLGR